MTGPVRFRFEGFITGLGSTSGIRLVVGVWPRSPLGAITDVMVESRDGHRVLLAPDRAAADFISATYTFDEIRVSPLTLKRVGDVISVGSADLQLEFTVGRRTTLGWLLQAVPARLAAAPWWVGLLDPVARLALRGVRTRGSAGNGRREWYGAEDVRAVTALSGSFDGVLLGGLASVSPPVRFGFGSVPAEPAIVRVVTTVRVP